MSDLIALHNGTIMRLHNPAACNGQPCCVHNPSRHSLDSAPLSWRDDRQFFERVCSHGIGHPDPDEITFRTNRYGPEHDISIHGCDGCCTERKK